MPKRVKLHPRYDLTFMDKITQTTVIDKDRRTPGKSLEDDAKGVRARLESIPGANVQDIGTEKLRLRGGDSRDAMIAAVRADAARKYQFIIRKRPGEEGSTTGFFEGALRSREVKENTRLATLKQQYESLSDGDRTCQGKLRSWKEVLAAIPDMSDFIAGVETIEQARVYFLNKKAQLLIGNGGAEPLGETLGWDYHKSRSRATRIAYIDGKGRLVVINDDTEIPPAVKILSKRRLITLVEYVRINQGQFDRDKSIWTESGKNPSVARGACWYRGGVYWGEYRSSIEDNARGSRRVLEINLDFKS